MDVFCLLTAITVTIVISELAFSCEPLCISEASATCEPVCLQVCIERNLVNALEEIKDGLTKLGRTVAGLSRSSTAEVNLSDDTMLPLQTTEVWITWNKKWRTIKVQRTW
ncbi:hypothetical protein UPYG_G00056550 [Umbra pygmaea]|uniref:Uncharacterized protein n=1 Tax=Umbra pygmaea TaxID=75934 RepID=A0ABD0XBS7_UMBPY